MFFSRELLTKINNSHFVTVSCINMVDDVKPPLSNNQLVRGKKSLICFVSFILLTFFSVVIFCQFLEDSRRYFEHQNIYLTASKGVVRIHGLNAHLWDGSCPSNLQNICKFPIFPLAPTLRVIANSSRVIYPFTDTVVRLFGFIHPPVSGRYSFSVEISSHSSFILTLSTDEQPSNSRRLSRNSEQILLKKGKKYFLDLVYHQVKESSPSVSLTWQKPGESSFAVIKEKCLSVFINDKELRSRRIQDRRIPETTVCKTTPTYNGNRSNSYFDWERIDYIEHSEVKAVLPYCKYEPSYNIHGRKVKYRWEGLNDLIQYTWWYPFPTVSKQVADPKGWFYELNQTIAGEIAKLYLTKLDEKLPG